MKIYNNDTIKTTATEAEVRDWVRALFRYEDGKLYRLRDNSRPNKPGPHGRMMIRVNGFKLQESVAIWLMFNDTIPEGLQIDHEDEDKLNNRIENLRLATRVENCQNRSKRKQDTHSKYKGVGWYEKLQKWGAGIHHEGKRVYLGLFATQEDAARAYNEAARKYHKSFAKLNVIED